MPDGGWGGLPGGGEEFLHDNNWNTDEVTITVAGLAGQQDLGVAVATGAKRRIRGLSIRHAGTNNTVVTILISGGATKISIDVPAQTTFPWSHQDGLEFEAGEVSAVQSSDVTGGNTFVTAMGAEA